MYWNVYKKTHMDKKNNVPCTQEQLTGLQSVAGSNSPTEPHLKDDEEQSVELLHKQINFKIIDFHTLLHFHWINQRSLSLACSLGVFSTFTRMWAHSVLSCELGCSTAVNTHIHTASPWHKIIERHSNCKADRMNVQTHSYYAPTVNNVTVCPSLCSCFKFSNIPPVHKLHCECKEKIAICSHPMGKDATHLLWPSQSADLNLNKYPYGGVWNNMLTVLFKTLNEGIALKKCSCHRLTFQNENIVYNIENKTAAESPL